MSEKIESKSPVLVATTEFKKSALAAALAEAAGIKPVDLDLEARKQGWLLKQGLHWFEFSYNLFLL